MLYLEEMKLEVGPPCSGSKYVFFTAFFIIIAGIFIKERLFLTLPISIITAILCNIMRIVSIACLRIFLHGEESIIFHNIIGIIYFIIALGGVYYLCKKINSLKFSWPYFS